jgi:hypothetical protein
MYNTAKTLKAIHVRSNVKHPAFARIPYVEQQYISSLSCRPTEQVIRKISLFPESGSSPASGKDTLRLRLGFGLLREVGMRKGGGGGGCP